MRERRIRIGLLLVVCLVAAQLGWAQKAPLSGGPSESVKVHGHWTIVVRNPDGSIVSRREFENSLQTYYAAPVLALLLSRQATMGFWDVILSEKAANSNTPCTVPNFGAFPCHVAEAGKHYPTPASTNLTVTAGSTLVLSGSFTASATGTIDYVLTQITTCPPTISTSVSCNNGSETPGFTEADISPVITVQSGQQVLVKVEISFS